MKLWREAMTAREQEDLAEEALRAAGSVSGAAKLLAISTRQLSRFLSETRRLIERRETSTDGSGSETSTDGSGSETSTDGSDSETSTENQPLLYGAPGRTLRYVSTAVIGTASHGNHEVVRVVLDLPKSLHDWLELQALRRKQRGLIARLAKAPIVVEALERYRDALDRPASETKKPRRKTTKA